MICPPACGQFWAGVTAGSGGGAAPGGPPTSPSIQFIGGTNYVRVTWTDYDATVATHIGYSTDIATEPTGAIATVGNGVEQYDTGYTAEALFVETGDVWWVRSYKNGQVSAWALAGGSDPGA